MVKRILLATLAIFVSWQILDFVIHSLILAKMYEETASLWRPMEEMKWTSMYIQSLISAFFFTAIYAWLIRPKNMKNALTFGLLFGLVTGASMGYGTYAVMPIPYFLAFGWFLGGTVECVVAGLLLGLIVKDEAAA
jgi:hypothetical protein